MDNSDSTQPPASSQPPPSEPASNSVGFSLEEKRLVLKVAHRLDQELTMRRWTRIAIVALALLGVFMLVILWFSFGQSLLNQVNTTISG